MCLCLSLMIAVEPRIGVRPRGPLLVFGQTAMFFYLLHRILLEGAATWFGLRGCWGLPEAWIVSALLLLALYPACLAYQAYKRKHPGGWTRYI